MANLKLWAGVIAGCLFLCLAAGCYTLYQKTQTLETKITSLEKDLETSKNANDSLNNQLEVQLLVQKGFSELAGKLSDIRENVGKETEVKTNVIREIIKTDNCSQSRVPAGTECVLKPSLCAGGNQTGFNSSAGRLATSMRP